MFRPSISFRWLRLLSMAGLVVCAIMSGCSASSSHSTGSTKSATNLPSVALQLNRTETATQNQIQLRTTITCGPWLVLAPHAASYTTDELAAMKTFVGNYITIPGSSPSLNEMSNSASIGYTPDAQAKIPPTLQYVPGDNMCVGDYEVTSTGQDLVQLNGVGFQLSQPGAVFPYDYHILDACSFMQGCACDQCGALIPCVYNAVLPMTLGNQALVMGKFDTGSRPGYPAECPLPINLQPGQTVPITVYFTKPASSGNVWFRGTPALSITSAKGTSTLTYSALMNTLVIVNLTSHPSTGTVKAPDGSALGSLPNIFPGTCYTLKGNQFTPLTSFKATVDSSKNPAAYYPVCV